MIQLNVTTQVRLTGAVATGNENAQLAAPEIDAAS
jgi:hypothetical protein